MDGRMIFLIMMGVLLGGGAIYAMVGLCYEASQYPKREAQKAKRRQEKAARDAKLFCPHCQKFGFVKTEKTTVKRGISGGKATAALLTGGLTMLATGLSQQDTMTKATCSNCGSMWLF